MENQTKHKIILNMKTETKEQPLLVQVFPHDSEPNRNVLSVFLDSDKAVFSETFAFDYESKADPTKEDFAVIENALSEHNISASIESQCNCYYHGTWQQISKDNEK